MHTANVHTALQSSQRRLTDPQRALARPINRRHLAEVLQHAIHHVHPARAVRGVDSARRRLGLGARLPPESRAATARQLEPRLHERVQLTRCERHGLKKGAGRGGGCGCAVAAAMGHGRAAGSGGACGYDPPRTVPIGSVG
eukprot:2908599-Prymnesium_polylepis.1